MTAAVYRSTPSLSVPQSQNTAPVLEFNCLFTHDVRKKQKKWQDGFLRYHTFNKRAMVYDVSRNLIGDCHWTGDEAIQEGDELKLERNGVMVEVGDKIGQTETDLTELRKSTKKNQNAAGAGGTPAMSRPTPSARPLGTSAPIRATGHQKHRSLGALLGTPKGVIGKAVMPQKSPFEERHAVPAQENEEWEDGRPAKRQRMAAASDWSVTRNSKAGKPTKTAETPLWARKDDAAKKQKPTVREAGQRQLPSNEVITLSDGNDDEDATDSSKTFLPGFSDDALAPSSPSRDKRLEGCKAAARSSSPVFQTQHAPKPSRPSTTTTEQAKAKTNRVQDPPGRARKEAARSSSPVFETQQAPETSRRATTADQVRPKIRRVEGPTGDMPPPVKTTTRVRDSHQQGAIAVLQAPEIPRPVVERPSWTTSRPGQVLRLASGGPKKSTLLCRTQVSKEPKRTPSANLDTSRSRTPEAKSGEREPEPMSSRAKLEARLAKIDAKGGSTSLQRLKKPTARSPPVEADDNGGFSYDDDFSEDRDTGLQQQSTYERSAIELRKLDEMMLPNSIRPSARPVSHREESSGRHHPQEDCPVQRGVEKVKDSLPPPKNTLAAREDPALIRRELPPPRKDPSPLQKDPSPARKDPLPPRDEQPIPPAPAAETRQLRRVASESMAAAQPGKPARVPGAPVRYTPTPSPSKRSRQATPNSTTANGKEPDTSNNSKQAPATSKARSNRPLQKSVSLNMTSTGTSKVLLSRPFNAPRKAASSADNESEPPQRQGPWSREAFDLFLWRPPNWDEEEWCVKEVKEAS